MESRILYSASKEVVKSPEIKIGRFNKDFSFGFYCVPRKEDAARWAARFRGGGVVNSYVFVPNNDLHVKTFREPNDDWLDFVLACRSGASHSFDIVEGPRLDAANFNWFQNLADGEITRDAFWALAKFKTPARQISFHTARALTTARFLSAEEVSVEKR
ncbi:MAG: DUF3990 domain-containing protein [Thermoguttaceae bacterium]|nr:DUF3990 domain-containing protein [Thermoguttaceae bacterium]